MEQITDDIIAEFTRENQKKMIDLTRAESPQNSVIEIEDSIPIPPSLQQQNDHARQGPTHTSVATTFHNPTSQIPNYPQINNMHPQRNLSNSQSQNSINNNNQINGQDFINYINSFIKDGYCTIFINSMNQRVSDKDSLIHALEALADQHNMPEFRCSVGNLAENMIKNANPNITSNNNSNQSNQPPRQPINNNIQRPNIVTQQLRPGNPNLTLNPNFSNNNSNVRNINQLGKNLIRDNWQLIPQHVHDEIQNFRMSGSCKNFIDSASENSLISDELSLQKALIALIIRNQNLQNRMNPNILSPNPQQVTPVNPSLTPNPNLINNNNFNTFKQPLNFNNPQAINNNNTQPQNPIPHLNSTPLISNSTSNSLPNHRYNLRNQVLTNSSNSNNNHINNNVISDNHAFSTTHIKDFTDAVRCLAQVYVKETGATYTNLTGRVIVNRALEKCCPSENFDKDNTTQTIEKVAKYLSMLKKRKTLEMYTFTAYNKTGLEKFIFKNCR